MALARALCDRGWIPDIAVDASISDAVSETAAETTSLVRAAGLRIVPIQRLGRRRRIRGLISQHGYDAVHWFELYDGVRDAALAAADSRVAFIWTIASGGVPVGYFGLNRVAVFTTEVAADVRRRSPATSVHLVAARVDLAALNTDFARAARLEVRQRLGLSDDELLIVRVARCAPVYYPSIAAGVGLTDALNQSGRRATFLHAGYVQDPDVAQDIRLLIDRANAAAGRLVARSITDDVSLGARYLAAADVCISAGRSALESIALERPTLLAWGSRYLGMVSAGNIDELARTNFQGRLLSEHPSGSDVSRLMHEAVVERLADPNGASTQASCARFVRDRYSVDAAADAYARLYADRTVTVEDALAHYGNPRHLWRALFHRLPRRVRDSRAVRILKRARPQL